MADLVLITCPALPTLFHDDHKLPAAFAQVGLTTQVKSWQEWEPDGTPVLIRTPWDYTEHRDAFDAWLSALAASQTPVVNPVPLMRWNMNKAYLLDLEAKGHAIVPTQIVNAFNADEVAAIAFQHGWDAAIAKPTVGAGATGLVTVNQDGQVGTFDAGGNTWMPDASALPQGRCLVQPLLKEIQQGEWSLFYFGGAFSHAILKQPSNGDIRVQEEHGGTTTAAAPSAATRQAADAIMADVPDAIYGRVDGVIVNGTFQLMELELIEPELYFRYADAEAVDRFAKAVAAHLRAS